MVTATARLVAVTFVGVPAVTAGLLNVTVEELLKCVPEPVMVTGRLVVPCCPELGLMFVIAAPPATVKPPISFTTSLPVVTVTSVAPIVALAVTETGTVTLVAVAAMGVPAVTAAFANVTTEDVLKWVNKPVMVTGTALAP
jgi:hypothetical protein